MFVTNHSGIDPRDMENAETLLAAFRKKNIHLCPRKPDLRKWSAEFRTLRQSGTDARPVLKWYCAHIGEQFVPDVRSASGFRKRFFALERAMKNAPDAPKIKIDDEVKEFVDERLSDVEWPKGSYHKLYAAVQESWDAHSELMAAAETHVASWKDKPEQDWPDTVTLAMDMLADHGESYTFMLHWFDWIHRRVRSWSDWNGSFRQFVFKPDHKRFTAIMLESAERHTGDGTVWDDLLKELR